MIKTASLENSKRIYNLLGWTFPSTESHLYWVKSANSDSDWSVRSYFGPQDKTSFWLIPAYDLSYLLDMLPALEIKTPYIKNDPSVAIARNSFATEADTPVDAVALLCIKLAEAHILKRREIGYV